jgi:hypothetical protein
VQAIEAALGRDISEITWMSDATKRQAQMKLRAVANKVGYPDTWRDYSALRIVRGDTLGNSQRANLFAYRRQLAKIGRPVDKTEWAMTPPTVNAYYNPFENNINFPAGILQPPFFNKAADDAVNFGHELTLLRRLGADVVREPHARDCAAPRQNGSAFAGPLQNDRGRVQHAGVPAGVRLQGWGADGEPEDLPGVVGAGDRDRTAAGHVESIDIDW